MHIQWTDLLRACESGEALYHWAQGNVARSKPPIPAGVYPQSSISQIVDDLRGIKTLGQCYTRPSFEAKIKY